MTNDHRMTNANDDRFVSSFALLQSQPTLLLICYQCKVSFLSIHLLDHPTTMLRKTHVALAGKIFPTLSGVYSSLSDGVTLREVSTSLHNSVDLADVVLLMFFGWASVPIARVIHHIFFATRGKTETRGFPVETFDQTYAYLFSDLLSQIAKVALLVLSADCLDVIMESLGYVFPVRAVLHPEYFHICILTCIMSRHVLLLVCLSPANSKL